MCLPRSGDGALLPKGRFVSSISGRAVLAVILGVSVVCTASAGAAEKEPDLRRLIEIVATVQTPEQQPPESKERHQPEDWEKRKDEIWVRIRLDAQRELTRAGKPAVRPLLELIDRTQDDSVKLVALAALSMMRPASDLKPAESKVIALLDQGNAGVRYLAVKTLGAMGSRTALPKLEKLVTDRHEMLRLAGVDAVGEIGQFKSYPVLLARLKDPEEKKSVRLHAGEALGKLGAALDVVPELIKLLSDEDVNYREMAVKSIARLVGYNIADDSRWLSYKPETRQLVIDGVDQWWKKTLEDPQVSLKGKPELSLRLSICLDKDQRPEAKVRSVRIIAKMGDPRAIGYLIPVMIDATDEELRRALAETATRLTGGRIQLRYVRGEKPETWRAKVYEFKRRWEEIERE